MINDSLSIGISRESCHFEIIHAGEFSLAGMGSTGNEQACDGAFFTSAKSRLINPGIMTKSEILLMKK